MSYQVIARKWRPQKFSDMVGQEHLARTLKNAITSGRTAHAYLFVGPRGIGKTTTARIFAKALNCLHPVDGEPCCRCSSCLSIADESSVDVIEIDAATHTQVEKARELCEDVLHLPISSKYKIYIIDEVHMLSKSAWNALLKTIEEPPAHAKFIFATTEVNKVLPTVISRCQRFDLRRISTADISGRLRLICDSEHVRISDAALDIIARAADGGMRDAQSLLDQMISFFGYDSESEITEDQALSLFGLASVSDMEKLLRAIVSNDRSSAVSAVHFFAVNGKNLEILYEEIIAWLRGILLCRIVDSPESVLEVSNEKLAIYKSIAATCDPGVVQRLMEQLTTSGYLLRDAINKQVFLESILLKSMRVAHATQIEDLIARLNQLRSTGELDAVRSVVPIYEMPVGQIVVPKDSVLAPPRNRVLETKVVSAEQVASVSETSENDQIAKNDTPEVRTVVTQVSSATEEVQPTPVSEVEKVSDVSSEATSPSSEEEQASSALPVSSPAVEVSSSSSEEEQESVSVSENTAISQSADVAPEADNIAVEDSDMNLRNAVEESEVPQEEPVKTFSPPVSQNPQEPEMTAEDIWQKMILDMRDFLKKDFLATAMSDATPISFDDYQLVVAFDREYETMQQTLAERNFALLNRRLRDLSGNPGVNLRFESRSGLATPIQVVKRENVMKLRELAEKDPFVSDIVGLFHGSVVDAYRQTPSPDSEEQN